MSETTDPAEHDHDDDGIDPAVLLMMKLRQDPRMADVPMYVTFPDGSTLSVETTDTEGGTP